MDLNKLSLSIQSVFYVSAGINHFIQPDFYLPLIPPYFIHIELINYLSGTFEILVGLGLQFGNSRKTSSYLLIIMLISFLPAHIYFIQIGSCIETGLCVVEWIAWLRLLLIHPLLIWWAWSVRKYSRLNQN